MPAKQFDASHRSRSGALEWTLLSLILALALALRVYQLTDHSLWLDEFWVTELSTGRGSLHLALPSSQVLWPAPDLTGLAGAPHWYAIWTRLSSVTHPPLYFIALRLWRECFGSSDAA